MSSILLSDDNNNKSKLMCLSVLIIHVSLHNSKCSGFYFNILTLGHVTKGYEYETNYY